MAFGNILYLGILACLAATPAFASNRINHFEVWIPETPDLTTLSSQKGVEIQKYWNQLPSRSIDGHSIQFQNPAQDVWIKIKNTGSTHDSLLVIGSQKIDFAELYHFRNGKQIDLQQGGPLSGRFGLNILSSTPLFFVRSSSIESQDELLIRVRTPYTKEIYVSLQDYDAVLQELEVSRALTYFFLGAFILVFVYQLAMYFGLREKFILVYLGMHTSFALSYLTNSGFFDYIFNVQNPALQPYYYNEIFAGLFGLCSALFNRYFFKLEGKIYRVYQANVVFALGILVSGTWYAITKSSTPLWQTPIMKIFQALGLFSAILVISMAVYKKLPFSKIILSSWLPVALLFGLNIIRVIPQEAAYSRQLVLIPILLELLIMSFVMLRKSNELNMRAFENQQAKNQNILLKQMLRTLSHDLTNQLFVIGCYAEKISQHSDSVVKKCAEKISSALNRSSSLIKSIRTWMLAEDGRLKLEIKPVLIYNMIQSALETFEERFLQKDITIAYTPPEPPLEPLYILADESAVLNQVINNALSNAIKFTPRGGKISLDVFNFTDSVIVQVRDNGVGISSEVESKINEGTPIASTPGTEKEEGTGFGMSLMLTYMQEFGGELNVRSNTTGEEKGTVVTLKFKKALAHSQNVA